jgi:hypothetical protein
VQGRSIKMSDIDKEDLPEGFCYATTEELSLTLGKSPEEAKAIENRVEYLTGNKPKSVKPRNFIDLLIGV